MSWPFLALSHKHLRISMLHSTSFAWDCTESIIIPWDLSHLFLNLIPRYLIFLDTIFCLFQFSSVQSCPTLCDPIDCSTPDFPVHHQLPEPTQIHVHPIGDAIQLSHPLSPPSPRIFNLSWHQGLFRWVGSSHQVAKVLWVSASASVLPMNIQDWCPLGLIGWISLQFKGL